MIKKTFTMSESTDRVITLEEMKEHKTGKSIWMSIHDKVYDVTKFLEEVSSLNYQNRSLSLALD